MSSFTKGIASSSSFFLLFHFLKIQEEENEEDEVCLYCTKKKECKIKHTSFHQVENKITTPTTIEKRSNKPSRYLF